MQKICLIELNGNLGNYIFIIGAFIKLKNECPDVMFKFTNYNVDHYRTHKINKKIHDFITNNLYTGTYENFILYSFTDYSLIEYKDIIQLINENDYTLLTAIFFQNDNSLNDNKELYNLIEYDYNDPNIYYYINKFNLIQNKDDYVVISVRRGDYINLKRIFYLLNNNFYKTIYHKFFEGKIPIITSDDINWCKRNLINLHKDIIYIENIYTINILKLCSDYFTNIICANSSFSSSIALLMDSSRGLKYYPSLKCIDEPNNKLIDDLHFDNVFNDHNKLFLEYTDLLALVIIGNTDDHTINYYLRLGFDHIFIISNDDSNIKNSDVTNIKCNYDHNHSHIIEYIYYEYCSNYDWFCVINSNEIIQLNNDKINSIKDYLCLDIFTWAQQIHINYDNDITINSIVRTNIPNIKYSYCTFFRTDGIHIETVNEIGNYNEDIWCHSYYDDTYVKILR